MTAKRPGSHSLQAQIYLALRRSILDGEFVPGKPFTIRGIAKDLGVSAQPVREALRRLVAERALAVSDTGRVSVPIMHREKLAELVRARICLERQAAIDAVPGVRDATVRRLEKLNARIDTAIEAGNHRRYLVAHRDFHFSLYRIGGGEVFLPLIESIWLQTSPFLRFTLSREHLQRYNTRDHHVEIIEALNARDATALGFAVEADIRHGLGALVESDWQALGLDDAAVK